MIQHKQTHMVRFENVKTSSIHQRLFLIIYRKCMTVRVISAMLFLMIQTHGFECNICRKDLKITSKKLTEEILLSLQSVSQSVSLSVSWSVGQLVSWSVG